MNALNHARTCIPLGKIGARLAGLCVLAATPVPALSQVATTPTMDTNALRAALNPVGLSIDSVSIHKGVAGQFGTFTNFEIRPVTIRPGIVLSSGNVTNLGPIPGATDPGYDPASPPAQVNNQMTAEPDTGGTAEFDAFGYTSGNIENFFGSYDVAALRVDFTLATASPIKFDFIFGSVEFPFYTGQFTDAFLVFLDGTDPSNQITLDPSGSAVQVGSSFAGLETTGDLNCAFANPHALIHHLTTTSVMLPAGEHFLIFEVGDVNDHILDSAVFIADLRAEAGPDGTDPTEDPPYAGCPHIAVEPQPVIACLFGDASFSISATGDDPLTYQWRKDHQPIDADVNPSARTATLTLLNVQLTDAGEYDCIVTNDCDSERSDRVTLTVCAADFNCDGRVNSNDVSVFLNQWFADQGGNTFVADFNRDGETNSNDVAMYLNQWFVDVAGVCGG